MVTEVQWNRPNALDRKKVCSCLAAEYNRTAIMASRGSLGYYMQVLSGAGFSVHEGNGEVWRTALEGARPFVGWVMVKQVRKAATSSRRLHATIRIYLRGFHVRAKEAAWPCTDGQRRPGV